MFLVIDWVRCVVNDVANKYSKVDCARESQLGLLLLIYMLVTRETHTHLQEW
jgi:hypothetical protein